MGNSIEKPANYTVVFGDMEYDLEKGSFECPPTTLNNKKKLPQKGKAIPEGEMVINLGYAKYDKDENGKIVNVQFLNKEDILTEEQLAKQGCRIAENGEIIRTANDSER